MGANQSNRLSNLQSQNNRSISQESEFNNNFTNPSAIDKSSISSPISIRSSSTITATNTTNTSSDPKRLSSSPPSLLVTKASFDSTNQQKLSNIKGEEGSRSLRMLSLFGSSSSSSNSSGAGAGAGERERSSSYGFIFGRKQSSEPVNNVVDDGKIKLLLLGPGNSGKTTLVKALKILYAAEPHLSQKEKERRVNEIRTTVITSAVSVIQRQGTKGWNQDVANAANTLLRASSSFIMIGDKVEATDDIASAPTASTVSPRNRTATAKTIDSDGDEDDDDDDGDAQVIATDQEVHDQITSDAAVAAALSEVDLENQAKARAAQFIPLPSHEKVPFTKATSIRSVEQPSNQSSNVSSSFNTTKTADIGRIVYDPKKHSSPMMTNNANQIFKDASSSPPSDSFRKHSSSSSPLGIFARTKASKSQQQQTKSQENMDNVRSSASSMSTSASAKSSLSSTPIQSNNRIATAKESFAGDDDEILPVAEHVSFDAEIVNSLRKLYSSPDFQRAMITSPSVDAFAGANDLVSHLDTIAASDYQGNDRDYLCAKTQYEDNSVHVTELKIHGSPFKLYDVSTEVDIIKDWSSDFESASAVVYLVAVDMYDYPDKVAKALKGFKKVCKKFKGKPIVLLLNKVDLMREKMKFVPFYVKGTRNDNYKGSRPENAVSQQEFDEAVVAVQNFIVAKYEKIWKKKTGEKGSLDIHFTQATAPDQINAVFKAAKHTIISTLNPTKFTT